MAKKGACSPPWPFYYTGEPPRKNHTFAQVTASYSFPVGETTDKTRPTYSVSPAACFLSRPFFHRSFLRSERATLLRRVARFFCLENWRTAERFFSYFCK